MAIKALPLVTLDTLLRGDNDVCHSRWHHVALSAGDAEKAINAVISTWRLVAWLLYANDTIFSDSLLASAA